MVVGKRLFGVHVCYNPILVINKKGKCVKEKKVWKGILKSPIFELSLGGGIALGHYTLLHLCISSIL